MFFARNPHVDFRCLFRLHRLLIQCHEKNYPKMYNNAHVNVHLSSKYENYSVTDRPWDENVLVEHTPGGRFWFENT